MQNNQLIPIKGYATFHPLKHCWIGSGFKSEWFSDLPIYRNKKIMDPLKRIADETEEDFETLEKLLKDLNVTTHKLHFDNHSNFVTNLHKPPIVPRDYFAVIGEKIYFSAHGNKIYIPMLKNIDTKNIVMEPEDCDLATSKIVRVGKDIWWDTRKHVNPHVIRKYTDIWQKQGFRIHRSERGHHSDGQCCVVRPGCIVSLHNVQNYADEFPSWEVLYLPDQSWNHKKLLPFLDMKSKVSGKWWLKGEEDNNQFINYVNKWLKEWVGYVEETVFDVNMLSIDENTIICNNHNKEVFEFFKKHKVEPIVFNFRHRYFWDGGIHCITQDLYREGEMEDYFG